MSGSPVVRILRDEGLLPPQRFLRRMEFTVTGGSVILSYPDPMDAADVADVRAALDIWLRGVERRAIGGNDGQP